jgi:hypothetical protein
LLAGCVLSKSDLLSKDKVTSRRQQERRFHEDIAGIRFRGEGIK